jgi:single-strand DNA-binding protein
MSEYNKVILIGRLTKDPELRYTPSGTAVSQLRLAVNHTYRTKEEKKEEVLYIDVNVFGRSAETIKQYLSKGREILVEGRLQQDDWTDKNTGQKRTAYRVVADRFNFIGSGRGAGAGAGGGGGGGGGGEREMAAEEGGAPTETIDAGEASAGPARQEAGAPPEDDLPF